MSTFTEMSIGESCVTTAFYVRSTLLGTLRAAFPDAWTGQSDLHHSDLILTRTVLNSAADLEVVDGVLGFHFDMGAAAEFTPLRTLRGLDGLHTGGEGGTWVIGRTLCAATQHLARYVPLSEWRYLRVHPDVADVTAERHYRP